MILTDTDIEFCRRLGLLTITPWNDDRLQAASYDLTLAPYVTHKWRDTDTNQYFWTKEKFDEAPEGLTYILAPNQFALFSTIETVTLTAGIAGKVEGKSTWARHGLLVEAAGFVDPGFSGTLTLELKNLSTFPLALTAGLPIAQILFMECRRPAARPYSADRNHYMGQEGPTKPWR